MIDNSSLLRVTMRTCSFLFVLALAHTAIASENIDQAIVLADEQNKTLQNQQKAISKLQRENEELRSLLKELKTIVNRISEIEERREISLDVDDISTDKSQSSISPAYSESFPEDVPDWRFSITPRTAIRFSTFHDFLDNTTIQQSIEEPVYWTNGATFTLTTPWLPNTSFLFTGLYGQDEGERITLTTLPSASGPVVLSAASEYDNKILDFEFLARTAIPDSNANWLAGVQYSKNTFEYKNPFGFPFGKNSQLSNEVYLLKTGLGGFFDLVDDGHHRIFSNLIVGGGIERIESDELKDDTLGAVGADINIGYEWIIDRTFSFSARYRGQFVYGFGGNENIPINDAFLVVHGPELHFTTRF